MAEAQRIFLQWVKSYCRDVDGPHGEWFAPAVSDETEILASTLEAEAQEMFLRSDLYRRSNDR